jgi:hypothetical protein
MDWKQNDYKFLNLLFYHVSPDNCFLLNLEIKTILPGNINFNFELLPNFDDTSKQQINYLLNQIR